MFSFPFIVQNTSLCLVRVSSMMVMGKDMGWGTAHEREDGPVYTILSWCPLIDHFLTTDGHRHTVLWRCENDMQFRRNWTSNFEFGYFPGWWSADWSSSDAGQQQWAAVPGRATTAMETTDTLLCTMMLTCAVHQVKIKSVQFPLTVFSS